MLRQMKGVLLLYNFLIFHLHYKFFFNPQDTRGSGVQKAFPEVQMVYNSQQTPNFIGESTNRLLIPWSRQMAILTSSIYLVQRIHLISRHCLWIKLFFKKRKEKARSLGSFSGSVPVIGVNRRSLMKSSPKAPP